MVLERKTDTGLARYLLGISLIAVSIYVFYVGTALRNSPELFLVPEPAAAAEKSCSAIVSGGLRACIPEGLERSQVHGRIEFYSVQDRIRGTIEVREALPGEKEWRASLRRPFIRAFIRDVEGSSTYDLMHDVLMHRYNPTLMGVKAAIIPSWMKRTEGARILTLGSGRGILFYAPTQSLGVAFFRGAVVTLEVTGRIPAEIAAGILASVQVAKPAEPQRGSTGPS